MTVRTRVSWRTWVDEANERTRAADRWRTPRPLAGGTPRSVLHADGTGREVVSFASNDYLGLSQHPAVVAAALDATERLGAGSGASRLVVGSRPLHAELEAALARWKATEASVLFPTGYAANLGVLTTLGADGVTILSDALNHASIIDGCRLARAESRVYRHCDVDDLRAALEEVSAQDRRPLIVSDTVFSMDGDVAPIDAIVELAARYDAAVVLDDAHAVLGTDRPGPHQPGAHRASAGGPAGQPAGAPQDVLVARVGTLSKTLGSLGGFVAGPAPLCDLLVNHARPYIFTTAPAPSVTAAALAAVRLLDSDEGARLVDRLRAVVDQVREGHPSAVVPVVVGAEADALALSDALVERGLLVPAIRPPTVPQGTSRLRIALSAAHQDEDVAALVAALDDLHPRWRRG